MCGIAGWYARRAAAVPEATIRMQCDAIRHRGPDDEGILVDGDFGFGMRRLSIVDIAGGRQPIETPDGRLAIVFNGEVYNHPALRAELIARGHVFGTGSDTETVLAAFREWGDDAWARMEGMFAVAIWDRARRRLVLARDHMGVKPLYYTEQTGGLAFASELKALLALPGHRFDTDPRAVHDFFTFGHVRTDRSIYAQVRMLPPGHVLSIDAAGDKRVSCFWRPAYRSAPRMIERDWIEAFRAEWLGTVERHLLADVEVGAFLSGGVDSSAVVAAMTRITGAPVRTFTIGFPVERYNEAPHAEAVARHLGCRHTTRIVELADARDLLPRLAQAYDEPFADASAIPTWYVSRMAREQVKVVLSGDGGDELFMGYKRHLTERTVGALPPLLRHAARGIVAVPPTPHRGFNRRLGRWQKAVGSAGLPDGVSRFFAKVQITSPAFRREVLAPDLLAEFEDARYCERLRDEHFADPARSISADTVEQFAYADLTLNLPCAMLTKVDRASMANSLEVRVPLLSPRLVEWGMGVPRDLKIRGGAGKYLLREAIRPWLPDGVVDRRKQGFQIPLAEWFSGDFGRHARELWQDSGAADLGYLDRPAVDRVFAEHRDGRRDHGRFLYALCMFSLWTAGRSQEVPAAAPTPTSTATPKPTIIAPPPAANDTAPAHRAGHARRVGALAAMLAAGWLVRDLTGPLATPAHAETFVDQAVNSHRATVLRADMRSQPEVRSFDAGEIARKTGVAMPALPADWTLLDVQIYPSTGGPSVELSIRSRQNETFSLFGMRTDAAAGATPSLERRQDDHVAYWEEGPLAFAVVGSLDAKRLLQLAALLDRPSA